MSSKWQSDIARVSGLNSIAVAPGRAGADAREQRPADDQYASQLLAAQNHIAALFQNLRRVLNSSLPEIATKLRTTSDVINSLETGRFEALPPWPETVRIVTAYTNLVEIDPAPALHVLQNSMPQQPKRSTVFDPTITPTTPYHGLQDDDSNVSSQLQQIANRDGNFHTPSYAAPAPNGTPYVSPMMQQTSTPTAGVDASVRWRKGLSGAPIPAGQASQDQLAYDESQNPQAFSKALGARVSQMFRALVGGFDREAITSMAPAFRSSGIAMKAGTCILVVAALLTGGLYSTLSARYAHAYLPAPLATAALQAHTFLSPPKMIEREGMRWIEAADPRSRRSDKLPVVGE